MSKDRFFEGFRVGMKLFAPYLTLLGLTFFITQANLPDADRLPIAEEEIEESIELDEEYRKELGRFLSGAGDNPDDNVPEDHALQPSSFPGQLPDHLPAQIKIRRAITPGKLFLQFQRLVFYDC